MEISFKDISRIIKKNIALVLVIAMLFGICSFFVTKFFIKKTYTSSVKLYVSVNYEGSSGSDDLSIYSYTSKLVATYIEMLDTNKFYSAVSEKLIPSMHDCKSSGRVIPNLPKYSMSISFHIHMESISVPSMSKIKALYDLFIYN